LSNEEQFDMLCHTFQREASYPLSIKNTASKITWMMRFQVIEYLLENSTDFHFERETSYLSIGLLDQILTVASADLTPSNLQLVTDACLYLACCIESRIDLSNFQVCFRSTSSLAEIKDCSNWILAKLSWNIRPPSPFLFLSLFIERLHLLFPEHDLLFQDHSTFCHILHLLNFILLYGYSLVVPSSFIASTLLFLFFPSYSKEIQKAIGVEPQPLDEFFLRDFRDLQSHHPCSPSIMFPPSFIKQQSFRRIKTRLLFSSSVLLSSK
jgi:hypothetical protein